MQAEGRRFEPGWLHHHDSSLLSHRCFLYRGHRPQRIEPVRKILVVSSIALAGLASWIWLPDALVEHRTCSPPDSEMVWIAGGLLVRGTVGSYPEEAAGEPVAVAGFWIDPHEVTNRQFARFVRETGYRTTAERPPGENQYPGIDASLIPAQSGSAVFIAPDQGTVGNWSFVVGASWRQPQGLGSSLAGLQDHPVVHISYADAQVYARWKGGNLPTESEWELAARAGAPTGIPAAGVTQPIEANTWQGAFPLLNLAEDGFARTAPVGCYAPNNYGLYDMIGNVWEWTSDGYHLGPVPQNPTAAARGQDPAQPGIPVKVIKGGSWLCAPNYCRRYRAAARQPQDITLGAAHLGFRTVRRGPQ